MRVVIDAGVLVSASIRCQGATGGVLRALRDGRFTIIYSTTILIEVIDVLSRSLFRTKYHIQPEDITDLVNLIRLRGELVTPQQQVSDCRDPKDNKYLEAALAGGAEAIISGDDDLLILHPFNDIPIWRPAGRKGDRFIY
ncbi:MAG: putative toxin-antitoxin system toxin component, PIN family [Coprothermobacterota bacterium]|nr:putative toxin-antitoxin system toxin component, PIN family [Coprothermobacterota bacterium]